MKYKPTHFTNDRGEILDEAFYRLGREYGSIFRDVVVRVYIDPKEGIKCGIHNPQETILSGCNPKILHRLVSTLNEWLPESGDFYDLDGKEDRWVVYREEDHREGMKKAVTEVISAFPDSPEQAAQVIVNTWIGSC